MKVPLSWLRELVDITCRLTSWSTLEYVRDRDRGLINVGSEWEGINVATVVTLDRTPMPTNCSSRSWTWGARGW